MLALGGCLASAPGSEEGPTAESASAVSTPTWASGAINSCADVCAAPNCNCIRNVCPGGDPVGLPCSPVGARCNGVSGGSYSILTCVAPPPPTTVWVAEFGGYESSCSDQCGALTCACVPAQCSPALEGQPCSTLGAECNAISNLDFYTLKCEAQ